MIEIELKKTRKSSKHHFQLDVNLITAPQKIIGLTGASGSGKSTFFKILSGLVRPDSGTIKVNNHLWCNIDHKKYKKPQQRSCSYLFQEATMFTHLTLAQNIQFANTKLTISEVQHWLSKLDLFELRNQYPNALSGGQQKRAALIMTLVNPTDVILLDEPFSALDEEAQQLVVKLIKTHHQQHQPTIFIASHNIEILKQLCHVTTTITHGKLDIPLTL